MSDPLKCGDCGEKLELGFIPDASYAVVLQAQWHPGTPEDKTFLGFRPQTLMGKDVPAIKHDSEHMRAITAYRCTVCGVLKLYAREKES
ncbi:hypothetical protein FYK55_00455 [Roseiconus nitratireducens]|uniref:Uncharacterized protein n=1 Tax=Roseiconus nitratireducens TaxID=2605748 RepID=A0A5M6DHD2_9BACT|nr:hypothetical protein [Roseiconus nitratireducens]KAA5546931.1 hypothetical protein FYK55_00455 [Roseiconus nitratireducens]